MKENLKFKEQFVEAKKYIGSRTNYVWFVILVMFFGGILGMVYSKLISSTIDPFLEQLVLSISGLNLWQLIVFILQNNINVAFFGLLLGAVFGIVPFFNALINGVIIGYVLKMAFIKAGIFELWKIFPHGIFELPAVIIALGMGIDFGMFIFNRRKGERIWERVFGCLNVFLFVVVPLLIIAALIEGALIFVFG